MGKIISVVGGAIAALIGLWILLTCWGRFVTVFLGTLPVILIFGGVIAIFLGVSEIKDEMAAKKEEGKKE